MGIIADRIRKLDLPESDCAPLSKPELDGLLSNVVPLVTCQLNDRAGQEFSIANLTPEVVFTKLSVLGVDEQTVLVCWPAFGEGFRVKWSAFLMHFDDLWHPSSDDVIVTSPSGCWALQVTHEETVRFSRLNKRKC